MSATNRGSVRNAQDFYATPKEAFDPMLPFIKRVAEVVQEPACGDGRLVVWMNQYGIKAYGSDLNGGFDFLADQRRHQTVVTNPPFSLAFEFCQHAVEHADHVFLLLRLNFLASIKRREWFKLNEPDALFVLSERPSFTPDGKTDATDYAWYFWSNNPPFKGIFHL